MWDLRHAFELIAPWDPSHAGEEDSFVDLGEPIIFLQGEDAAGLHDGGCTNDICLLSAEDFIDGDPTFFRRAKLYDLGAAKIPSYFAKTDKLVGGALVDCHDFEDFAYVVLGARSLIFDKSILIEF